jgi:hypothetical protein
MSSAPASPYEVTTRTRCTDPARAAEARTALDTENEAAVVNAPSTEPLVTGFPQPRIRVARRLSTIRRAEHVLFLENGRIIEDGTVSELISASLITSEVVASTVGFALTGGSIAPPGATESGEAVMKVSK